MIKRLIVVILLLLSAASVAQGQQQPPPQVTDAVNLLSRLLGRPLALSDFSRWSFSENTYDSTALGCPLPGQTYTQGSYLGYRVELVLNGVTYDVRVSTDRSIAFLCSPTLVATVPPGATLPAATPSACPNFPVPHLSIGIQARVVAGGLPNNVRAEPARGTALVGEIPAGATFTVLDGPRCSLDGTWWRVDYNGLVGWTVEADATEYWLEPAHFPTATATLPPPITPTPTLDPRQATAIACNPSLPSRLQVGGRGRVTPGDPNNIRSQPSTSGQDLGEIAAGTEFEVLEGPVCGNGLAWWRVRAGTLEGWTAEGQGSTYWIEPTSPPPSESALTPETIGNVVPESEIAIGANAVLQEMVFSPDGRYLIVQTTAPTIVAAQLYDLDTPDAPPLVYDDANVSGWVFNPDSTVAAGIDLTNCQLLLWNVPTNAVNPLGDALAQGESCAPLDSLWTEDNRLLFITPDQLFTTLYVWDAASGEVISEIASEALMTEAILSPDGSRLAVSMNGESLTLWDLNRDTQLGGVTFGATGLTDFGFSGDGARLYTVEQQFARETVSEVRLWDVSQDSNLFVETLYALPSLPGADNSVQAAAANTDGSVLLISAALIDGTGDGTLVLGLFIAESTEAPLTWELDTAAADVLVGEDYPPISALAVSRNGLRIAVLDWNYNIQIFTISDSGAVG